MLQREQNELLIMQTNISILQDCSKPTNSLICAGEKRFVPITIIVWKKATIISKNSNPNSVLENEVSSSVHPYSRKSGNKFEGHACSSRQQG